MSDPSFMAIDGRFTCALVPPTLTFRTGSLGRSFVAPRMPRAPSSEGVAQALFRRNSPLLLLPSRAAPEFLPHEGRSPLHS